MDNFIVLRRMDILADLEAVFTRKVTFILSLMFFTDFEVLSKKRSAVKKQNKKKTIFSKGTWCTGKQTERQKNCLPCEKTIENLPSVSTLFGS